jgi:hypothetical protein
VNCKSGRASLETRWRCLIPSGPQMNSRSSCPTTQVEAKLPIAIPGFASYGGVGLVDVEFDAPPGAIVVVSCQSCGNGVRRPDRIAEVRTIGSSGRSDFTEHFDRRGHGPPNPCTMFRQIHQHLLVAIDDRPCFK